MSPPVGVGIDLVDVARLEAVLRRRPRVADRVFTDHERDSPASGARAVQRLAARFAAKEAAMKALGVGIGAFPMREIEVVVAEDGRPSLVLHGSAHAHARRVGVRALSVSLTHTSTLAAAVVVAESTA